MSEQRTAYVALGANLPFAGRSPAETLSHAAAALAPAGLRPRAFSGLWETAAWPPSDQPVFFNAVTEVEAGALGPQELYAALRSIEDAFGRERRTRWGPRTLDLDVLSMDGAVGAFGDLTLPHPRLHERAFVLAPLAEVAPYWRHPLLGSNVADLLLALPPGQGCRRIRDLVPA